ncbi:zf-CCHC domain-containing protein [Tanacetum coccineum]|uniref:Zf-CCHC domain-containing protein n=1 Tax=Tanacetum coccineum TaxID=301880 RepID=A0ABQ5E0I2_9ASTR
MVSHRKGDTLAPSGNSMAFRVSIGRLRSDAVTRVLTLSLANPDGVTINPDGVSTVRFRMLYFLNVKSKGHGQLKINNTYHHCHPDELIGNLKVHEMIIKKDSKIVKAKGERKYLALKAKKESSDEGDLRHHEMTKRTFQKVGDEQNDKSNRKCIRCDDPNHLIRECPKPPKDKNQRAFVEGSWSDSGEEDDEKVKDETCLVAQASNEICLGVDLETDEWIKDIGCSKKTHEG